MGFLQSEMVSSPHGSVPSALDFAHGLEDLLCGAGFGQGGRDLFVIFHDESFLHSSSTACVRVSVHWKWGFCSPKWFRRHTAVSPPRWTLRTVSRTCCAGQGLARSVKGEKASASFIRSPSAKPVWTITGMAPQSFH